MKSRISEEKDRYLHGCAKWPEHRYIPDFCIAVDRDLIIRPFATYSHLYIAAFLRAINGAVVAIS